MVPARRQPKVDFDSWFSDIKNKPVHLDNNAVRLWSSELRVPVRNIRQ